MGSGEFTISDGIADEALTPEQRAEVDERLAYLVEEGFLSKEGDVFNITEQGWTAAFADLLIDVDGIEDVETAVKEARDEALLRLFHHVGAGLMMADAIIAEAEAQE